MERTMMPGDQGSHKQDYQRVIFYDRACIFRLKLYNKVLCHDIVLRFTAQEGFRGDVVGKKGIIWKVDLKWGLLSLLPSLHEMTIRIWLD